MYTAAIMGGGTELRKGAISQIMAGGYGRNIGSTTSPASPVGPVQPRPHAHTFVDAHRKDPRPVCLTNAGNQRGSSTHIGNNPLGGCVTLSCGSTRLLGIESSSSEEIMCLVEKRGFRCLGFRVSGFWGFGVRG